MIEAALGGVVAALISSVGAVYAARAAKNSKPVSNGFANNVQASLARIEKRIDEHLRDHANGRN